MSDSSGQAQPGVANNAIPQINGDGLPSTDSFPNFLPIGGDGPSSVTLGNDTHGQGLGARGTVGNVVLDSENNTRRVRGNKVEQQDAVGNLTSGFDHSIFQESPYQYYVQKPGSDGEIFTPYIQPVQTHNLGRTLNLQGIRYHSYHMVTEKPPDSWRLGITEPDVVASNVQAKLDALEHPEINAFGLDVAPTQ